MPGLAVVVSRADSASTHVRDRLLALADWTAREDDTRPDADGGGTVYRTDGAELREFDDLHLHLAGVADAFCDPDLLAFASRHAGETGPLLTAHATGNFGPATYGGDDRTLAAAAPNALAHALESFDARAPEGYETGLECTHHGPTDVGCPSLFVELGSDEPQWADPAGARAVARTILDLRGVDPRRERTVVGFGGGHYAPRFERVVRETDWAVGHVAADWALGELGDPTEHAAVLGAAFEHSGATRALVDGDHPGVERAVASLGHEVVSETWLRETTGVDLGVVERVEADLGPVATGVRLGAPARDHDPGDGFSVRSLPADLLAEANGIDRDRVRDRVARHAVAFDTAEGATKAAGRVAVADAAAFAGLVDALVEVLGERYDEVVRTGDEVVARTRGFDPSKARELGVPEGPAFGRLADGRPVEVDGTEVRPAEVTSVRETRIPLE